MKSKTLLFFVAVKIILAIAIVSADLITPGFKGMNIGNYIENINDFPDYVFVSGGGLGPGMCPLKIIGNSGEIDNYYKFCSIYVYAIPKENFNETRIEDINFKEQIGNEEIKNYFESLGGKEVVKNLNTYHQISVASTIKAKKNYYTISLNEVKTQPDRSETLRNNLIYWYILLPIMSLLIIIFILIKRGRK